MNDKRRVIAAYAVAAALFAASVGLMTVPAQSKPTARTSPQSPPTREILDSPRDVQGVPCSGYLQLAPDGRLVSCILARDHAFGETELPANTQIYLRADGTPENAHLGRDTVLEGHVCLGRGPGEWMAGFHPNGRLAYCFLANDETIDGIPCRHGSFWGEITGGVVVRFHDNGLLATCRLAADMTIAGDTHEKGSRIVLDTDGNVVTAVASSP